MGIKVLVVDDSPFMRKIITEMISEVTGLTVVGTARNGRDALKSIPLLKPDIVTLDIEMPGLNGLETLKIIKQEYAIPVVMMSSHSGEAITIEALELGAMDFIEKPVDLKNQAEEFKKEIEKKIKPLVEIKEVSPSKKQIEKVPVRQEWQKEVPKQIKAIVIGASTGGPKALLQVIQHLPENLAIPIFIVQHMPKGFTLSFAERLNMKSSVTVVEAKEGMTIENGTVYLAPGDYHMTIKQNKIALDRSPKILGVRPAVDYLFQSAASVYESSLVGVILTGMGHDGSVGMSEIKKQGGFTLAQDRETAVVYGMPGNAIKKGVVDEVASLTELSDRINWMIRMRQWN
ncbi:protein-glutamate methylesterase/protein-glutamine glutaminase [Carnobacterium funditum]|uniref:protein-glutamate methylesterase/protein-glutamine glutaminase n=1 Tax=Carnobacterium funditum TaxID=2752 RepID=UPI000691DFF1|nr:chemotaxis response regulator protein-glutamate methylesterase [Carnobacterium funditum]